MYAPESSDTDATTCRLQWEPDPTHIAQPATYTTRPGWTCALESAWSRFAKFQILNCLNWQQLSEALAIRPVANASAGVDLRAADVFDLASLASTLRVGPHELVGAFCTVSRHDALLDAASPSLRFCPICAATGFHATLFQFTTFKHCPVHRCALREACTRCGQPMAYRLHAGLVRHPYACPACGLTLLAAPLRRLHQQGNWGSSRLECLRAWHDYFSWHVRLLCVAQRRERDASGQYLCGEEIRDRSEIQRRLAFIGALHEFLHRPPRIPRLEPASDVASERRPRLRSLGSEATRCAWSRNWPHVDSSCIALNAVYRNTRRNHVRRLARSISPVQPGADAISPLPGHGMLLIDSSVPALWVALLGWRMSWERRFSLLTLAHCGRVFPPFGLLEWLAFMPVYWPPVSLNDRHDWLLHHFAHALGQTWNAWCAITSSMQENGHYVISPLLLPTRVLWIRSDTP